MAASPSTDIPMQRRMSIDHVPGVMVWYEEIGFVCFNPRSSVFCNSKTEMKSKKSTVDIQILRQMSYRRDQQLIFKDRDRRSWHKIYDFTCSIISSSVFDKTWIT